MIETGNLARGKPITASSQRSSNYRPGKVLDGVYSTRWEGSKSSNQWLKVDLGSGHPIGRVSILWMASTTKTYELQASDDNNSWITVAVGTTNGTGAQLIEHNLTNLSKRYVRVLAKTLHGGSAYGHSIRELSIYAPLGLVYVCGLQLCMNGEPFIIHGGTAYGQVTRPVEEVALARQFGINTLELVRFEEIYNSLPSQTSENTWRNVDQFMAEAGANDVKVILNLSGYFWSLEKAGLKPTNIDWGPYLSLVMNRINTITGIAYKSDPTIAMVELIGEIPAPNSSNPLRGTNAEIFAFFVRTLGQLRTLDQRHVISSGGFSYLNEGSIDWQPIMRLANNQVCGIEINSYPDRDITVPMVTEFCQSIGKPWFLAAFSSCLRAEGPYGSWDINHYRTESERAAHHADMYEVARGNSKATFPAVGADFWNLSNDPTKPVSCDIGTHTPQVLSVVQRYAPPPSPPPPVSKNQLRMPTGIRLRGVNIVPTFAAVIPADQGSVWSAMWRTWDWAGWLQPQIDDAAKIGNAVRFFGNTHCIAIGTVTRVTYMAHWRQVLDYCASKSLYVYPCGGDLGHWGGMPDTQAIDIYSEWADILKQYPLVVGVDITNEAMGQGQMANDWSKLPLLKSLGDAVRSYAGVPVSHSIPIADNNWWGWDGGTVYPIRALCEAGDVTDWHVYVSTTAAHINSVLGTAWGTGKHAVIGEFGVDTRQSSATRTARYNQVKDALVSRPADWDGAFAWSCWDLGTSPVRNDAQYGTFDPNRVLRRDIATPFATIPVTR